MASSLSRVRLILWVVVAGFAATATGLYLFGATRPTVAAGIGHGDYVLTTAGGEDFSREDFNGSPSALFFGFTHCPDVCPTTLAEMTAWKAALGDEGKDLKAYFITVDPERDTPEIIGDYVAWTNFVTGLTGTTEQVAKATKAWAAFAEKVPLENGDYTMDHTASVFLLNRDGEFEGTIAYREDTQTAIGKLQKLIKG